MTTEFSLIWFLVGMGFGLSGLLSLAVGYYLGRKYEGEPHPLFLMIEGRR